MTKVAEGPPVPTGCEGWAGWARSREESRKGSQAQAARRRGPRRLLGNSGSSVFPPSRAQVREHECAFPYADLSPRYWAGRTDPAWRPARPVPRALAARSGTWSPRTRACLCPSSGPRRLPSGVGCTSRERHSLPGLMAGVA